MHIQLSTKLHIYYIKELDAVKREYGHDPNFSARLKKLK